MRYSTPIRHTAIARRASAGSRRPWRLALLAQAAAVMLLAACGGGEDGSPTSSSSTLSADGSQQQANAGTSPGTSTGTGTSTTGASTQTPAVDATVPPLELPAHIKPVNYKLWFRPNADLTGFSGRADVEIKVTKQTGEITLAARNLRFDPARVTLTATGSNTTQMLVPVPQSQGDFYDLRLPTGDIKPGTYMLHMEWTGTVNFTKAEGLFKLGLQGATGEKSDALITQGAANLSRQWFPCWDEPAFRHTFELTAEVPGDWKAIANGKQNSATQLPDGYQRVAFAKTPSMPSYLMFFGGGKFDVLEDQFTSPLDTSSTLPLRWWVPAGEAHSAVAGMQYTKEALNYYYNYFQIPLPLDKIDTIAANDSYNNKNAGFGGMENWGAIFEFADQVLVPPEGAQTSIHSKGNARSFVVVSHELAHQWFGDLVTLDWWDNIWLNESFANWFENITKIELHPEFTGNSWEGYAAAKQRIYTLDLAVTAVPVQHNLSDTGSNDFLDRFAYHKGGHVLQMIENYIGHDAMRRGLQAYLNKYKFGNGTPTRLWAELEAASDKPVSKVGDSFVRQTGVPLVTIDARCNPVTNQNVVTISQRAFPSKNMYPGYRWNIPLVLKYGENFSQTQTLMFDQAGTQISLPTCSAVLANPTGLDYYVTNYSPALWSDLLAQAGAITDKATAANIAGDATQLYNAGLMSQALYSQITGIRAFQPVLQTLRTQSVAVGIGAQQVPPLETPVHSIKYQGVMKHLSDLSQ
ncbi:M1 family metallopeptidase [Ralstonia pseudosolanacearum]|uniref:M1 family metallopeptidase n=1 Tax=Ralstonia pseudosolanacearum TaxID=1310165 RepID=UPI000B92E373|nr:M1 family metallopeptidase [Ralstonia pseudosolanacearum]